MTAPSEKLELVIENRLYDITKFAKIHPGGVHILKNFNNTDATDYFYAVHSNDARKMLKNMPSTELPDKEKLPESDYLKLMYKLEKTDLFTADYVLEAMQILHTVALFFLGWYYSQSHPLLASLCMGIGTLLSGWIGHQCDHQRNNVMRKINQWYAPIAAGFSIRWWADKHNLHHLTTNEIDADTDIQLSPFIYLWAPKKSEDAWNRAFQHIYFSFFYSTLHLKWMGDGIINAVSKKIWVEIIGISIHWIWYFSLPWQVWLLGGLISGTISAWVVTASHQAEQKLEGKKEFIGEKEGPKTKYQIHDYFTHQLVTTRNIDLHSWLLNYLCGGMQYQIEHHVFPRVPLYKLSQVKPIVMEYCKEHGIEYMQESLWEITKRNYSNVENFAKYKI